MVPFKPYFLGIKTDLSRAASCQKCFRTTDIDRVGATVRHLTFFEMLGNFSFGDYFKEESIAWAWEFMTREMGLDPKRLYPSVFKEDEEAYRIWMRLGVPNPPVRLGENSNFWNMGPTGPCGPCSEIYFDRGEAASCGRPSCSVGCDCDRYLELWNLVFTQFDRQEDGSLKPLPRRNIDTGMGLERLLFTLEDRASPFETDLFAPLVEMAAQALGVDPRRDARAERAFRVIADHARASAMLMAEGVIPSNVERGYVLRRLIRRAVRHGQILGHPFPFLHKLVLAVAEIFGEPYPEIREAAPQLEATLRIEEQKFLETLGTGQVELAKLLGSARKVLPGEQAFSLYETYGFPLELTREICAERGIAVDEQGFRKAAQKAAEIARASWKGSGERAILLELPPGAENEFTGYESLQEFAEVVAVELRGERGVVVLDRTPFYPEGGGQVGDEGVLLSPDGKRLLAKVIDTQRQGSAILHLVKDATPLEPGDKVLAKVDAARRHYIAPHHTGTHLLNEALRRILGTHVRQAGSYVGADKLRFDFTHPKALDPETIQKLEALVADEIKRKEPVLTRVDSIEKVKAYGALTLLGEDYGEKPRFVLIGGPKGWKDPKERFSLELCGGTHVRNTAELAAFKILKESSVASGIRRIEAVAGRAVEDALRLKQEEEEQTAAQLMARQRELLEEIHRLGGRAEQSPPTSGPSELRIREKELKELLRRLRSQKLSTQAEGLRTLEVKGIRLCLQRLEGADPKSLRSLADRAKAEIGSGAVFLATPTGGKLSFVLAATQDLLAKGFDAAKIAKALAQAFGGSAGGRADFAQGGIAARDWEKIVGDLSTLIGSS